MLIQTQFDERLQGQSPQGTNQTAFQGSWQQSQSRGNFVVLLTLFSLVFGFYLKLIIYIPGTTILSLVFILNKSKYAPSKILKLKLEINKYNYFYLHLYVVFFIRK